MQLTPEELGRILRDQAVQLVRGQNSEVVGLPLASSVSASDPGFTQSSSWPSAARVTPRTLLGGARSVLVMFLPLGLAVVDSNRRAEAVARQWAEAYVTANAVLTHTLESLARLLEAWGFGARVIAPTGDFDRTSLTALWSHRHAGVLAGLGVLGENRLLITERGCAGRLASLVTTAPLSLQAPPAAPCLRCGACRRACPVGALKPDGSFDRHACYRQLQAIAQRYAYLPAAEVCGKCVTGPCSIR